MMSAYRCPHCGKIVAEEDLLEVSDEIDEAGSILSVPPPKHLTVTTEIDGMVRVLTLSAGHGSYFTGVGPFGRTRSFSYNRDTKVAEDESISYGRHGQSMSNVIRLTNKASADTITICSGFSDDAQRYVAAVIRRECTRV